MKYDTKFSTERPKPNGSLRWLPPSLSGCDHFGRSFGNFGLSFPYINAVLKLDGRTSTEKLVLLILANHADKRGFCWPSFATIAKESSLYRRSVIRTVAKLEQDGLLRRERRFPSNGYHLLVSVGHQTKKVLVTKKASLVSLGVNAGVLGTPKPSEPSKEPSSFCKVSNGDNHQWKKDLDAFKASLR
jgi:hypothetical protein